MTKPHWCLSKGEHTMKDQHKPQVETQFNSKTEKSYKYNFQNLKKYSFKFQDWSTVLLKRMKLVFDYGTYKNHSVLSHYWVTWTTWIMTPFWASLKSQMEGLKAKKEEGDHPKTVPMPTIETRSADVGPWNKSNTQYHRTSDIKYWYCGKRGHKNIRACNTN